MRVALVHADADEQARLQVLAFVVERPPHANRAGGGIDLVIDDGQVSGVVERLGVAVVVGQAEHEGQVLHRLRGNLALREEAGLVLVLLADDEVQHGPLVHVEVGVHLRLELDERGQDGVVGDDVVVEIDAESADASAVFRLDVAVIDVGLGGLEGGQGGLVRFPRGVERGLGLIDGVAVLDGRRLRRGAGGSHVASVGVLRTLEMGERLFGLGVGLVGGRLGLVAGGVVGRRVDVEEGVRPPARRRLP